LEYATQYFHPDKINHVILLSDGIDTCSSDPCKTVENLKKDYPNFRVDTVGFTLQKDEIDILDCISEFSGGEFYEADSLYELRDGIRTFFYETDPETGNPIISEEPEEKEDDMVYIEGGTYIMGNDKALKPDEKPAHEVFIQSMLMKMTEVTNQDYAEFLNEAGFDRSWIDIGKSKIEFINGEYKAESGAEDLPVVFVTWFGADAYARHYGGRLPYEAEWEFAAYGREYDYIYPWGEEEFVEGDKMANYDYSRTDLSDLTEAIVEVANYEPNEYGLYDISGNVWEWCHDWYSDDYYEESEKIMPVGPIKGRYKVRRGGSWFNNELSMRITNRGFARPSAALRDTGFRYVIPINPESLEDE
jgi:formylglycine-generating enzyme required for sulfatase activity